MGIQRYTQNHCTNHLFLACSIQVIFYWHFHFPLIAGSIQCPGFYCHFPSQFLHTYGKRPDQKKDWLGSYSGSYTKIQDHNPKILNSCLMVKVTKFATYLCLHPAECSHQKATEPFLPGIPFLINAIFCRKTSSAECILKEAKPHTNLQDNV